MVSILKCFVLKKERKTKFSDRCVVSDFFVSLLNQIRFESIDFLMREVSPDTRKEIMDCALEYDDEFDGSHISDGKYIRDWFHSETG